MKHLLVAGVAALALLASGPSFAQGVGVQVGPVGAGITFAPEQRTRIKEYVVKRTGSPDRDERTGYGRRHSSSRC